MASSNTSTNLPIFSTLLLFLFCTAASGDDSAAMSALLAALKPTPSGWSSSASYCSWASVTCDSSRVTSINLAGKSLSGTLPSDLASLSHLRYLSLQKNNLTGALPSLANLSSLRELYLDNNNFTSLPTGFFHGLTSLQILSLSINPNLARWSIPADLGDSANLLSFYADNSNIHGTLPEFLGSSLPSLQNLRVSYNHLSGPLPSSLAGAGIRNLWLNNQSGGGGGLSGTLDVLSTMQNLYQAWLQNNAFSGPIPDLSRCRSLSDLQLHDNQLTGLVPTSLLLSIPTLNKLSLDMNKLQGPVPENPRNISFTYKGNNFCNGDSLGPCNDQVTALLEVSAALGFPAVLSNSWVGNDACDSWSFVSCGVKGNNNVSIVNLGRQKLNGSISPAFGNLTSLRRLILNDNNLMGSIPSSLTTLPELQTLDLSNNNLSGPIPVFPATVKVIITGNSFIGSSGGGDSAPSPAGLNANYSGGYSVDGSSGRTMLIVGILLSYFYIST